MACGVPAPCRVHVWNGSIASVPLWPVAKLGETIEWSVLHDPTSFDPVVQAPDPGDNLFIGRGESRPQHNVARYWCERAQRAEQALATAAAKDDPDMWALFLAEQRRSGALEAHIEELAAQLAKAEADRDTAFCDGVRAAQSHHFLVASINAAAPGDLPAVPTRPDGTLAPEPKPWGPPKSGGDPRRVGG